MALSKDNAVYIETLEVFEPYKDSIKKPELFTRPPLKFIASLVDAINKKTGFGSGYFTSEQLSGVLENKEQKLDFIQMLHHYVEHVNKEHIKVTANKVVAGQEVESTLKLLQAMVKGANNPKMDFSTASRRALAKFEREKSGGEKKEKKEDKKEEKGEERKEDIKEEKKENKKEERKEEKREERKEDRREEKKENKKEEKKEDRKEEKREEKKEDRREEKREERKEDRREEKKEEKKEERKEERREEKKRDKKEKSRHNDVPSLNINAGDDDNTNARPMTARKAPPKVREEQSVVLESKVTTIIKEATEADEVEDDIFVEETTTGTIHQDNNQENGALVKQILEQCNQANNSSNNNVDFQDHDRFKQSIEFAKGILQALARSAQPLDTLIQFSQEDLGNMVNEYSRWSEECKRQEKSLENERSITEQILSELNSKIEELDKDIIRQESKLRSIKASALLKENELMKEFSQMCQNQ